mgnify:CR=1 FL=1
MARLSPTCMAPDVTLDPRDTRKLAVVRRRSSVLTLTRSFDTCVQRLSVVVHCTVQRVARTLCVPLGVLEYVWILPERFGFLHMEGIHHCQLKCPTELFAHEPKKALHSVSVFWRVNVTSNKQWPSSGVCKCSTSGFVNDFLCA